MHSSLVRIQNVFGFFTTVAFAVAAVVALSVVVSTQNPSAKLEMRNVQVVKGRPHYYSTKKEEYAHVKFDLDAGTFLGYGRLVLAPSTLLFYFSNEKLANTISADLTSLFSWNTKQVFVYVVASFPPTTNPSPSLPNSEAIIWDAIIPASSAPLHPNTYIHPTSSSSSSKSSSASKSRRSKSKDQALAHPVGASPGILRLNSQRPKYQITTPSSRISNLDNCTLTLHYNIQPWVGALVWGTHPALPCRRTGAAWRGQERGVQNAGTEGRERGEEGGIEDGDGWGEE
ncbi:Signal peptidase complex subunit [Taxawa tesnikishii (nom. ined.)]|nr:Signal peptidase complex subunit [Dothideales sp. JES 119]